jgi:cytochrome oxidase Cu insertion factor (SCO1/SenC/PrrC family)
MSQTKKRDKKKKKEVDACCAPAANASHGTIKMGEMAVSNHTLTDQNGDEVKLYDLIKGKVVAMNFIFTTCTTICPPMGANFSELNRRMKAVRGDELAMISVSIDPGNDTPERLKSWSDKFNAGPGWTLLTGETQVVYQLLKELKVFSPLKEDHAPILLIGTEGKDDWIRTNGLADADLIESTVKKYLSTPAEVQPGGHDHDAHDHDHGDGHDHQHGESHDHGSDQGSTEEETGLPTALTPAQQRDLDYFTDTKLVNQNGEELRFYSDLLKDKIVFINPFFAECTGSCPVMHKAMQEVQIWLGDRLGKEVVMISLTVDPVNDTPERLQSYAREYGAKPGWHFLSGNVANVETVTRKLGKYVEDREAHDTIILIGNLNTKLWKKANGLANPMEIIAVLKSVMEDEG